MEIILIISSLLIGFILGVIIYKPKADKLKDMIVRWDLQELGAYRKSQKK